MALDLYEERCAGRNHAKCRAEFFPNFRWWEADVRPSSAPQDNKISQGSPSTFLGPHPAGPQCVKACVDTNENQSLVRFCEEIFHRRCSDVSQIIRDSVVNTRDSDLGQIRSDQNGEMGWVGWVSCQDKEHRVEVARNLNEQSIAKAWRRAPRRVLRVTPWVWFSGWVAVALERPWGGSRTSCCFYRLWSNGTINHKWFFFSHFLN